MGGLARLGWVVVLGVIVVLLVFLLMAAWKGGQVAPEIAARFSAEEIGQAAGLARIRYLTLTAGIMIQLAFWGFLFFSGWGKTLSLFFEAWGGGRYFLALALFFLFLFICSRLLHFPLQLYGDFYLEKAYGLGVQGFSSWLRDYFTATAISLVLSLGALLGLYVFIARWPAHWWLPASAAALGLTVLFTALGPLLYDPLFHRFEPLEDRQLKERLVLLAGRAGLEVDEVLVMDASTKTNRVNAYFTGIGRTKRVVLYDNLVNDFSREEVASVLAHELAHWKRSHLVKGIAAGSLAAAAFFHISAVLLRSMVETPPLFLESVRDPAGIVVLVLVVTLGSFLVIPARNYLSRGFEREADRLALELTENTEAQAHVMEQLSRRNLSNLNPHPFIVWFFYSHPPAAERIRFAENFEG